METSKPTQPCCLQSGSDQMCHSLCNKMIYDIAHIILEHAASATRTPEEAFSVLNVLPQHDPALAAVLSRGFNECRPALAIKHGHGLALLPYYQSYVILDDLHEILFVASNLGDLPTIELLWVLAGPTTAGRTAWFEGSTNSFVSQIIEHGHVSAVEWLSHAVRVAGIPINWSCLPWDRAFHGGRTGVLNWAIAHGYLMSISSTDALLSTRKNEFSVMEWWIASKASRKEAMSELQSAYLNVPFLVGAIGMVDWWWANTGSKLPNPFQFAAYVNTALTGSHIVMIEWCWARFLEHRTPEHLFGKGPLEIGQFKSIEILEWYYQRYNETPEYFASDKRSPHGLDFVIKEHTTLPILQWAVKKCTELGGQKLKLMYGCIKSCANDRKMEKIDFVLRSANVLEMEWPSDYASGAIHFGQLSLLEWWHHNQDQLPPQKLAIRGWYIYDMHQRDPVAVFEWWRDRFPMSKDDWQCVCIKSIMYNVHQVQLLLRDDPALLGLESNQEHLQFISTCLSVLSQAKTFSHDFVGTLLADLDRTLWPPLPMCVYHCISTVNWWCHRANVTFASFLPLPATVWEKLFEAHDVAALEWWLQAHLAAGIPAVFPSSDQLENIFKSEDDADLWMSDVTVTRKIVVFAEDEYEEGVVEPYTSPPFELFN
ncbi:hypothetical protein BC828DRAFT_394230 [Blastocladiella britannica]|nr:hypothetical protein BC828DRAFT_394230 [Blastocladiella britannica]